MLELFIEHAQLALLPWFIGTILGGGLGYVAGVSLRRLLATITALRIWFVLLPGRTVVLALVLVLGYSPISIQQFGIGRSAAIIILTGIITLLEFAVVLRVPLVEGVDVSQIERLVAGIRTLAVASVALAVFAGYIGAGGAGILMVQGLSELDMGVFRTGLAIVLAVAATTDMALGIGQIAAMRSKLTA